MKKYYCFLCFPAQVSFNENLYLTQYVGVLGYFIKLLADASNTAVSNKELIQVVVHVKLWNKCYHFSLYCSVYETTTTPKGHLAEASVSWAALPGRQRAFHNGLFIVKRPFVFTLNVYVAYFTYPDTREFYFSLFTCISFRTTSTSIPSWRFCWAKICCSKRSPSVCRHPLGGPHHAVAVVSQFPLGVRPRLHWAQPKSLWIYNRMW